MPSFLTLPSLKTAPEKRIELSLPIVILSVVLKELVRSFVLRSWKQLSRPNSSAPYKVSGCAEKNYAEADGGAAHLRGDGVQNERGGSDDE